MLRIDHLAVSCTDLAAGAAWVEDRLGVPMQAGGAHPLMGTHNRLLGLGDVYLEVIAIDPTAAAPAHPRWFGLDRFDGPPRLTNWIAACDDLDAELARGPAGAGHPVALSRGAYRWRMAVPETGLLPFDNLFPALIEWQGDAHPAPALTDRGIRLASLTVTHPEAGLLGNRLAGQIADGRLRLVAGPVAGLRAEFDTPQGRREL